MRPRFVTIHLHLTAQFYLSPLVAELESRGLSALFSVKERRGWRAIVRDSVDGATVGLVAKRMVRTAESLKRDAKRDWDNCSNRIFELSYQGDIDSLAHEITVPIGPVKRIASVGGSIRTSVHLPEPFILSEELKAEQSTLEAEIIEAFKDVNREGTLSWGQSVEADLTEREKMRSQGIEWSHWTEDKRRAKKPFHDRDRNWLELVNDPKWETNPKYGGLGQLDPVGQRYYLPAMLIRSLREPEELDLAYVLALRVEDLPQEYSDDIRNHFLWRWSALNNRQRRCLKRFLEHKIALGHLRFQQHFAEVMTVIDGFDSQHVGHFPLISSWKAAYESYWKDV